MRQILKSAKVKGKIKRGPKWKEKLEMKATKKKKRYTSISYKKWRKWKI